MPAKHQPDLIYLRYVPLWKVHVFTLVQLSCLVMLWVIKASAAAVVFPMMVTLVNYAQHDTNNTHYYHIVSIILQTFFFSVGFGASVCAKASRLCFHKKRA